MLRVKEFIAELLEVDVLNHFLDIELDIDGETIDFDEFELVESDRYLTLFAKDTKHVLLPNEEHENLQNQLKEMEDKVTDLEKENAALKDEVSDLQSDSSDKDEEIEGLKEEIRRWEEQD